MKLISCATMRDGIIVAIALLVVGGGLLFFSANLLPNVFYLPQIGLFLGGICILIAPLTIISTFIVTVWPGARKKMDNCER